MPLSLSFFPTITCEKTNAGRLILTKKMVSGLLQYIKHWPGAITVFFETTSKRNTTTELDAVEVHPSELPCNLSFRTSASQVDRELLLQPDLIFLTKPNTAIHDIVIGHGIPVVYVLENPLSNRRAILASSIQNPLRRLTRSWHESWFERNLRDKISQAIGIQCNGTPAYEAYKELSPNPLLFFDGRINESQIPSSGELQQRLQKRCQLEEPLRLAFSGRLISIKGPQFLPRIGLALKQSQIPFSMEIFGDGVLHKQLQNEIESLGLTDQVFLRGTVDFHSVLVPHMKSDIDLFICCHIQSDPSCTYLEVLSCGVPIIGFDNDAFKGIVNHSKSGWISPISQPKKLAEKIIYLSRHRKQIAENSMRARDFSTQHAQELTFKRRIEHLLSCAKGPKKK